MAEGARLESVFRGNSNVGSNPTLSAINLFPKMPYFEAPLAVPFAVAIDAAFPAAA